MTNKRNAEYQIAKQVRRHERANLALDAKQRLQDCTTKPQRKETERGDTSTEGDSDLRYHISASKNNPQDIFSIIRRNKGDPAYHV